MSVADVIVTVFSGAIGGVVGAALYRAWRAWRERRFARSDKWDGYQFIEDRKP
ncbi:MAG TPA: hypothetical protein VFS52_20750 [Steroidobacteraceae bacterium]|nr:hypothetical protein [Steroidobacteraceae bacterium]